MSSMICLDRLQLSVQTPPHLQNGVAEATIAAPTASAAVTAKCRHPSSSPIPGGAPSQLLPQLDPPAPPLLVSTRPHLSASPHADPVAGSSASDRGRRIEGRDPRRIEDPSSSFEAATDRGRLLELHPRLAVDACSSSTSADALLHPCLIVDVARLHPRLAVDAAPTHQHLVVDV
jgi:hypothetical protein